MAEIKRTRLALDSAEDLAELHQNTADIASNKEDIDANKAEIEALNALVEALQEGTISTTDYTLMFFEEEPFSRLSVNSMSENILYCELEKETSSGASAEYDNGYVKLDPTYANGYVLASATYDNGYVNI